MSLFPKWFGKTNEKPSNHSPSIDEVFAQLDAQLRKASVAQVGGFRPPDDPLSSWFGGHAVGLPGESIPESGGKPMFPLLQVNCSELPYVPDELKDTALFVVWLDQEEIPLDTSQGVGWEIREYASLDGLRPLPDILKPSHLKTFPIRWTLSEADGPGWEDAWGLVDLAPVNESEEGSHAFFERYASHPGTKVGGFPAEIQGGLGGDGTFVFQIGSEEKANWMWGDCGIGYFLKGPKGYWEFQWQCY